MSKKEKQPKAKMEVVHNATEEANYVDVEIDDVEPRTTGYSQVLEDGVKEDPFKDAEWFDYADMVIECSACGKETRLEHPGFKNVKTGLQLPFLYTLSNEVDGIPKFLAMSCSHCDNKLTLKFVEAANPPVTEATVVEDEPTDEVEKTEE